MGMSKCLPSDFQHFPGTSQLLKMPQSAAKQSIGSKFLFGAELLSAATESPSQERESVGEKMSRHPGENQ